MAKTKGGRKKAKSLCISPTFDGTLPKRLKRVSWRDEELENVNIIPSVQDDLRDNNLQDPAILMVGHTSSTVRYTYDKEVLMKLRHSPFSIKRPEYLDPAHDNNGTWDPERWHMERRAAEGPAENGNRGNGNANTVNELENHRRRPGDPKDRLRREHDGIVLSPQRRSFNSGCFVPVREPARTNRSHSPIGGKNVEPPSHIGHREIPQGPPARRIGSGRILGSWENQDKYDVDNDFSFRRERRDTDRDDRFERRPFNRDSDQPGMGPPGRQQQGKPGGNKDSLFNRNGNNGRYGDNRRRMDTREIEEPEWFSEGPTSQHDTIELRGFDDSEKIGGGKKKQTAAQKKKAKELLQLRTNKLSDEGPPRAPEDKENEQRAAAGRATPTRNVKDAETGGKRSPDKGAAPPEGGPGKVDGQDSFNLDEFLQSDIPMLTNGVGLEGNEPASGSRFSQWFKRGSSPGAKGESRRSSMQDEHHFIKTILSDITEPVVNIPGDSDSYFAPISPAANTGAPPSAFMEMMRGGKQHGGPPHGDLPPNMKNEMPGKVLSLEELEAQMRKGGPIDVGGAGDMSASMRAAHMNTSQQHNADNDNAAFKKLLAQMHVGNVIPANNGPVPMKGQPMSILEMLTHSQKQDEAHRLAQLMNSATAAGVQGAHDMTNDLTFKLQQAQSQAAQAQRQQLEAFTKLMQSRTPPPINEIGLAASRELLSRPEAQAILQGLKCGDITVQNLYKQLQNPAIQSRHRELLQTIVKMVPAAGAVGPSPRVLSPMPHAAALFQQQQQQQLRVSPLPPNAMHQRIPSPRELQLHTQSIMQKALIKKKLEEQSENFRKKQETQQRGGGGPAVGGGLSPAKSVASPTQLAWGTPTSVLRKMTAEKDDGKDGKGDAQSKILQQQGRALTGMRNQVQQQAQVQQQTQQQQQQQQWNAQFQQLSKQQGRPIVKNNAANFPQAQMQQHEQFLLQQRLYNQQQQQQQRKQQQSQQQQQQFAGQFSQQFQNQNTAPQYNQHQLRAQHQARAQHQQQQGFSSQQQQQQQQWLMQSQNFENRQMGGRGGGNDGDMSPTSNQLARWFSPDLLDRARKGKLPNMPPSNLAQHAMSLEEIERQTAPAVHN